MMTTSDHGSTAAEWALVLLVIACGLWLRGRDLGSDALLIDEGESAVDAMTILESGTPGDRYLGLPHFENTLLTPWPESAEYEFRDSSHSPLGHTIYHGWLPLYAIAASLRLAGIQPDAPPGVGEPLRPRYTRAQMNRRAAAARAPSVLFAALFLAALYASGRALHGREAGLLALTVGAFSTHCISIARMARYYSATLAFTTLGIYLLYRLCRGAGRGSCLTLAMTLVLLFHCNTLAFLVLAAASLAALPIVLRAGELRRGGVALGVLLILLGTLPWAWATGFLTLVGKLPAARDHLDLPSDLLAYVLQRPVVGLLFLAGLATAVAARLRPGTESTIGRALAAGRAPLPFLLLILALAYSIFMALIPAASFFPSRLTLLLLPAGLLLGAVLGALGLRAIAPRRSQGLCIALTLSATLFMTVRSSRPAAPLQPGDAREAVFDLIEQLRRQPPAAGTRLYSTPQQQFPLCLNN